MQNSRRSFLKASAIAIAGAALLPDNLLATEKRLQRVGVQLYSVRDAMAARSFFKKASTSSAFSRRIPSSTLSELVFATLTPREVSESIARAMEAARIFMRECVDGTPQSPAPIRIWRLQNRGFCFYSILRSEFCNYAVGPWVSVAGRGTALARGNPAIRKEEARTQKDRVPPGLSIS